jgi:hypothetical protein
VQWLRQALIHRRGKGIGEIKVRGWFLTLGQCSERLGAVSGALGNRYGGRGSSVSFGGGGCAREGLGVSEMRQWKESGCARSSKRS